MNLNRDDITKSRQDDNHTTYQEIATYTRKLLGVTAIAGASMMPYAVAEDAADSNAELAMEEVVVSGSRLIRSGLISPVPVTSLGAEEIAASGATSLGDLLTELPSMANTSLGRTTNGGLSSATEAGSALLDLRGLGVNRTLVMVNGRRHVGASAASGSGSTSVDINSIPVALIERVEVTTGGGSVSYGADAVSGVVNIIMKDDFEGLALEARGGISDAWDARNYYLSATGGANFADDRGNINFNITHESNKGVNDAFARGYFQNQQVLAGSLSDTGPAFVLGDATTTPLATIPGVLINLPLGVKTVGRFADDGTIVPFVNGAPTGTSGRERGGDGFDLRDTYQIMTPLDRTLIQGRMTYEIDDNINFFAEGKFYSTRAFGQGQSSADIVAFAGQVEDLMFVTRDNPYIQNTPFSDSIFDQADAIGFPLVFSGFHMDMGRHGTKVKRDTFQIAAGFNGEVTDKDWKYEVYYQNGQTDEDLTFTNSRDMVRFRLAFDAVTDELGVVPGNSAGDVACRSTVEAYTADAGGSSDLDVNGCVPINVFGSGNFSQEALDYVRVDVGVRGRVTQEIIGGSLAGDLFELFPAGEVSFAGGLEYRKETSLYSPGAFARSVRTEGSEPDQVSGGNYNVFEGYLEMAVPLIRGEAFAEELNIEGGIRVSDYSSTGTSTAWRVGGDWVPTEDIRFRAIYARAVRAPNITELFAPRQLGGADLKDPCTETLVNSGPNPARRLANCQAQMAPLGLDPESYTDPLAGITQTTIVGGNPNLDVEKAKTLTIGMVYTPEFIPGLTLTVDYFNIKIENAISSLDPQKVVDNCIDAFDSIDNQWCDLFDRSTKTTEFGRLTNVSSSLLNFENIVTKGIDYEINYSLDLADSFGVGSGMIDFRLMGTYLDTYSFTSGPDAPVVNLAGNIGRPKHRVTLNTTYSDGGVSVTWNARFIGGGNLDVDRPELATEFEIDGAGGQVINDMQVKYALEDQNMEFYAGINNIFDAEPPIMSLPFAARNAGISEETNISAGLYDMMGRYFYGGVRVKF